MTSPMDILKKSSTLKSRSNSLDKAFKKGVFDNDPTTTPCRMLNVALSGDVDGGFTSGILTLAGSSKHFKTGFALYIASAYLKKHKDAILIFYDTEFGTNEQTWKNFDIDTSRVIHTPIFNIEELKTEMLNQLKAIDENKLKAIIIIDSIGNSPSKKELDDSEAGETTKDMTRAGALKSFFRMVTVRLRAQHIPFIGITHSYTEMKMHGAEIASGGKGQIYASDDLWIIGRAQDKDKDKKLTGYTFKIKIDKSRSCREKSIIPITVSFAGGVQPYSGLLELAVEGKYVHKGKKGRSTGYGRIDMKTGVLSEEMYLEKETNTEEFWQPIFKETDFKQYIKNQFLLINNGDDE